MRYITLLLLIATSSIYYSQTPIVSTFDSNSEGWFIEDNGSSNTPDYFSSGGNPGGYISDKDAAIGPWYFVAPGKFYGEMYSAYNKTIEFDLKLSITGVLDSSYYDVYLIGGGGWIAIKLPNYPTTNWTSNSILINENAGWVNPSTGLPATYQEVLGALSYLQALTIRGDYIQGFTSDTSAIDNVILGSVITSVYEGEYKNCYADFYLMQNYPNPFNPMTLIQYQIPIEGLVTIKAYDVLGNKVAELVDEEKPAGTYEIVFNGSSLPSGVYFYRMQAGNFRESKKFILLK